MSHLDYTNQLRKLPEYAATSYLIGAGFSRASSFQLPTAIGFLVRKWQITFPGTSKPYVPEIESRHATALDYIEKNYGSLENLNLEAVLADLHIRCFGIGRSWEDETGYLQFIYGSLIDYIRHRLLIPYVGESTCPLINRFLQSLRSQDHLITLNYDTLLEFHIEQSNNQKLKNLRGSIISATAPFVLGWGEGAPKIFQSHDATKRGFFAKLHGSIDWAACPNIECPQHTSIEILSSWARNVAEPSGQYRCSTCGSFPETVIIPPIAPKAFERFPKLGIIWHRALNCINRSCRLVLIGVSLAITDLHLASFLRNALQRSMFTAKGSQPFQLCVVSKDIGEAQHVAKRLMDILPIEVTQLIEEGNVEMAVFCSVEDYVTNALQIDADRKHSADDATTSHDY